MSRTRPQLSQAWDFVKERYAAWRQCGYPPAVRGAWPGRKRYARARNKSQRVAERSALRHQDEAALPVVRHAVKYDVW